jgi:hypothetical protein
MQLEAERNAKTRFGTGKIRGLLFPYRSRAASQMCEGQPETKTPTTAATEAGAMYIQSVGAPENYGGFPPVARGVRA